MELHGLSKLRSNYCSLFPAEWLVVQDVSSPKLTFRLLMRRHRPLKLQSLRKYWGALLSLHSHFTAGIFLDSIRRSVLITFELSLSSLDCPVRPPSSYSLSGWSWRWLRLCSHLQRGFDLIYDLKAKGLPRSSVSKGSWSDQQSRSFRVDHSVYRNYRGFALLGLGFDL